MPSSIKITVSIPASDFVRAAVKANTDSPSAIVQAALRAYLAEEE